MDLYLLPHGQALPLTEDPGQPLSRQGIVQIKAVATVLQRLKIPIDTLIASGEKRSRQSAALIAEGINYPYSDIVESPLVAPEATTADLETLLIPLLQRPSALIAGHRPSLGRLLTLLLNAPAERLLLEPGALVHWRLTSLQPLQARLCSWLSPEQVLLLAGAARRG